MAKDISQYLVRGLVAAVFTPMTSQCEVDLTAIDAYAKYLVEQKVLGVFVNGTTGEFCSLTVAERKSIVEAWSAAKHHGLNHLMVHVGTSSLKDSQELARHAEEHGADAIGMISPSFFKPPTLEVLVEYSRQVAAAAPNTPFYYYHIPPMTGVNFDMEKYLELAGSQIPTLRGIKYSFLDMAQANQCLLQSGGKYNLLWGVDQQYLAALALGIDAAIGSTYNYLASTHNDMVDAFERGDLESARAHQAKIQRVINIAFSIGTPGVSAQKALMQILTPVKVGPTRLPIPPATDDVIKRLQMALLDMHS